MEAFLVMMFAVALLAVIAVVGALKNESYQEPETAASERAKREAAREAAKRKRFEEKIEAQAERLAGKKLKQAIIEQRANEILRERLADAEEEK